MRPETRVGTIAAVGLHLGAAALVSLTVLISPLVSKNPEPLVVMELVSFPDDAPVTMGENQLGGGGEAASVEEFTPEPAIEVASAEEIAGPEIPNIPTLDRLEVPPPPAPEPEPVPAPRPTPTTPAPQPTPPPAPTPAPTPAPQAPQMVSLNEFRRQHGQPRRQPARQQPARQTVVAPSVSSSNLRVEVPASTNTGGVASGRSVSGSGGVSMGGSGGSGGGGAMQENYLNRIRRILDSSWNRPTHLPKGLSVDAEFRVGLDGRISLTRLLRTSGNSEFDETVRQAFQNAARAPSPPNNQPLVSHVGFRLD